MAKLFTHYVVATYSDGRRIVIAGHFSRSSAQRTAARARHSDIPNDAEAITVETAPEWLVRSGQNISTAEDWPGDQPFISDAEVRDYVRLLTTGLRRYVATADWRWLAELNQALRDGSSANSYQRWRLDQIMEECAREYGRPSRP
jgi:hypothetical protein